MTLVFVEDLNVYYYCKYISFTWFTVRSAEKTFNIAVCVARVLLNILLKQALIQLVLTSWQILQKKKCSCQGQKQILVTRAHT